MGRRALVGCPVGVMVFLYAIGCLGILAWLSTATGEPNRALEVMAALFFVGWPFLIVVVSFVLWLLFVREDDGSGFEPGRITSTPTGWVALGVLIACIVAVFCILMGRDPLWAIIPALMALIAGLQLLMISLSDVESESSDRTLGGCLLVILYALLGGGESSDPMDPMGPIDP